MALVTDLERRVHCGNVPCAGGLRFIPAGSVPGNIDIRDADHHQLCIAAMVMGRRYWVSAGIIIHAILEQSTVGVKPGWWIITSCHSVRYISPPNMP